MSRPSLPARDVALRNGIPVTVPARTLVDLATELGMTALERAVNEADKHDLIDPEALLVALADFSGEPGVRPLRALLDRQVFSRLRARDSLPAHRHGGGPPQPQTKAWVNGYEVDFFWPELGLVVETDGLRYHRTASEQILRQTACGLSGT